MANMIPTPHPRRRALAELDARIAQAEKVRAERLEAVQAASSSERAAHVASVVLQAAEERLVGLRRSRAALSGEQPPG